VNAEEKRQSAMEICSLITFYEYDFEKLKKQEGGKTPKKQHKWEPPQPGFFKINIDASFQAKSGKGGWGFVARGNNGEFLERGCGHLERVTSSLYAEALAALKSLQRVAHLGMTRIVLETDATNLERGLRSNELDRSLEGGLFRQIRDFIHHSFAQCVVRACPQSCNKVADSLLLMGRALYALVRRSTWIKFPTM